jgi:hypothetical protein
VCQAIEAVWRFGAGMPPGDEPASGQATGHRMTPPVRCARCSSIECWRGWRDRADAVHRPGRGRVWTSCPNGLAALAGRSVFSHPVSTRWPPVARGPCWPGVGRRFSQAPKRPAVRSGAVGLNPWAAPREPDPGCARRACGPALRRNRAAPEEQPGVGTQLAPRSPRSRSTAQMDHRSQVRFEVDRPIFRGTIPCLKLG